MTGRPQVPAVQGKSPMGEKVQRTNFPANIPAKGGHTNSDTDLSACVPTARRITTA